MAATREFPPRLMPAPAAAHYLGVSVSLLRTLPIARKELNSKRVYDKSDLDAYANNLPYEGESDDQDNPCDELFGATS